MPLSDRADLVRAVSLSGPRRSLSKEVKQVETCCPCYCKCARTVPGTPTNRAVNAHDGLNPYGGQIPDPHCPVTAGGSGHQAAVRRNRHCTYPTMMARQARLLAASDGVPGPHRPVATGG